MNQKFILVNVLVIATCGLVYELLAGTIASYLLGDSVLQFSTIIGVYLFAMGVGSWLSRYVEKEVVWVFIEVELGVALLGGLSAPIFFISHAYINIFQVVLYTVVFLIGTLVGLEIPLLMRILKDQLDFKELVSRVLAFDYVGALIASLAFPLFLMPNLGVLRTSLAVGIINALVGLWATWLFRETIKGTVLGLRVRGALVIVVLGGCIIFSDRILSFAEDALYSDRPVFARNTPYQRIVVTRNPSGNFRLYLNGHLQFNSLDEYRYHEALVHPAMCTGTPPKRVLVMGGGDGLALREVLRHPSVEAVTLVDLDPGMTSLSKRYPPLGHLNEHAFDNPKVEVVNQDAFIWVQKRENDAPYDVVIIDFPDPHNYSLAKLYTTFFYRTLQKRLAPGATIAIQCTSPYMAPKTYWCIVKTMETAGFKVKPYHCAVPSFFGIWGFALAKMDDFEPPRQAPKNLINPNTPSVPVKLRFLNDATMTALFAFPEDLQRIEVEVNRLDHQVIVQYHEVEWKRFVR